MSNSKIYLGSTNLGTGKIKLGANDVSAIYLGTSLLYPPTTPPTPTVTYVQSITEDADYTQSQWNYTHCIDTGVPHNTSTTTVRIKYTPKDTYSDRIVGYFPSDSGCSGDNNDFRIFSFSGGSFDYETSRGSSIGVFNQNTYYDLTMGDNFVYDNINETYLYQGSTIGSVPSQGCHIFVDVSTLYVDEVIIMDGNTTLFDGIAAYDSDGHIGLYDTISDTLIYNSNLTMTYTPIPTPPSVNDFVCFEALEAGAEVQLQRGSNLSTYPVYLYASTDNGQTFTRMERDQSFSMPNIGDKVYIYGNNTAIGRASGKYYSLIVNNKQVSVSGDLTRLLNPNGVTTLPDYAFNRLFQNSNGIVDASGLTIPVTTVGEYAFNFMFAGCSTLQYAPTQLEATNLSEGCYSNMFANCTSLITVPTLPATTLAEYCYLQMFAGCTSLATAPALPALTMENYCYSQMFEGCSGLTTAPVLPALTLDTDCYNCMFRNCTSLNSVTCLATDISALNCTDNWLENVSSTGTFTKNQYMSSWTTGIDGIPSGWTVEDYIELLNPTVTITSDDGEGNYDCYFTAECTDTIFQSIDGQTINIYVDDNGTEELVISDVIDSYSDNYSEVFRDFAYTDPYDLTNGGRFEIVDGNDDVITSGNWTYANVTGNCDNLTFPTVNSIEVEETADGWIGRITLDDDLSNYDGYYISVNGVNGEVAFEFSNDLMDEIGEYVGNNTFEVGIDFDTTTPTAGTYNDFTVSISIGKFAECYDEYTDLDGEVITL